MTYRLLAATFRLGFVFLVSAIVALSHMTTAQAQAPDLSSVNDQTQTPIPGSGHDYQHLLGETVNMSNGSVDFRISFPVAKSRGITVPYAWTYNSAGVNSLGMIDGNQPAWNPPTLYLPPAWNTTAGIPNAWVSI